MLNVLPFSYKTALHQSLLHHRVRSFSIFATLTMVVLASILLSTEWLLQRWQKDLPVNMTIAQITPEERDQLELLITQLQQTSQAVQTTNQQFRHPLTDVAALLRDTPTGIELHDLSIDYVSTEVRLTGTAADRETLVSYQQAFGQLPFLSQVIFPLTNLATKEQIPFSVTAHLEL